MIEVRPFAELGGANHGWLKAKHHFSFANYYDPSRMSWGPLRVWNDDEIAPQTGFPPHPHANMEIITYVREGAITHQDSMGNKGRTEAGDVQVMSAGTGVRHSEYNMEDDVTRIFQIWIPPTVEGGKPSWGAKPFPKSDRSGRFVALASGFAQDNEALPIRAQARVLGANLKAGETVTLDLINGGHSYLVPAKGAIDINGTRVNARDGAAVRDVEALTVTALEDSEVILVEAANGELPAKAVPRRGLTPTQVQRAKDFMAHQIGGDISLSDVARQCGLSRGYFAECFKATTGVSPHQWLQQFRIDKAKSLLARSPASIAEIATICGFADQSHLTRVFSRLTGDSPAVWRRQMRD